MKWHIGCSGFHYKHWKGSFYPEDLAQSKWFEYYCRFFNTLELNVTFYRFPKVSFLQNWERKSPPDFHFAVKAPRFITHYKQFSGTVDMLSDFYYIIQEGLKDKLGCVLFQLPPRFSYSQERLDKIIDSLDSSFLNVVEFRHSSWWRQEAIQQLGEHNITFCGMSHPLLPDDIIHNAPLLYYRLHGKEQLYTSNYSESELLSLYQSIDSLAPSQAYIFFNNDIETFAVFNAQKLSGLAGLSSHDQSAI